MATRCTSVCDIITDTIIPIYASGETIQTTLLLLFLFAPAPTYDFKQTLHKILVAYDDNKPFINGTENTGNTACSNANAVYWIYTRTKQK